MEKYKHLWKEFKRLHEEGWSLDQISGTTGKTKNQVGSSLRNRGIKPIRYDKLENISDLNQVLIGSMLGDGYMNKMPKGSHSYMTLCHGPKQLCYLEYKKKFFDHLDLSANRGIKMYRDVSNRYKKGYTDTYSFHTRVHPLFSDYRTKFYPANKKVLDFGYLEDIEGLGLAIWYMDDGQVCTSSYQINTTGFLTEECNKLVDLLKRKFDLDFTVQKDNILYLRTSSIEKFEKLIIPSIPKCMTYKIRHGSI